MITVQKIVIDVFMYIFEALLLWYYANSLFEEKKNKAISIIASVAVNAILMTVYQFKIVYLNGIMLFVLYFLFFVLLYRSGAYLYVVCLSKLLHSIIIVVLSKLFAFRRNKEPYNKYYWLLFLMPISSVLMVLAFRYLAYDVKLTPFVSALWVVASILTIFSISSPKK